MDVGGQILRIIAEYKQVDVSTIEPTKSFAELDIDSLEAIDIIYEIEDRLRVEVPQESLDGMTTVADMLAIVSGLADGQAG